MAGQGVQPAVPGKLKFGCLDDELRWEDTAALRESGKAALLKSQLRGWSLTNVAVVKKPLLTAVAAGPVPQASGPGLLV